MYTLLRSFLFLFPPESVHHFSMNVLRILCRVGWVRKGLASACFRPDRAWEKELLGRVFRNPVGLAAGFDKNAKYLRELETLGFGFVEIGTVTPRPQPGNDKPRLFRLPKDRALINRMGFNNDGVVQVAKRLRKWKQQTAGRTLAGGRPMLVGGNIGKNKATPNEEAWKDYETAFVELFDWVDYFVVNVSSPNTPGLRELQQKPALRIILAHLQDLNRQLSRDQSTGPKPLLLKISPDLTPSELADVLDLALEIALDGLVVANTTIARNHLCAQSLRRAEKIGTGGLSGLPLQERSTELIQTIYRKTRGRLPLVGSGGIFTPQDVKQKTRAGASLVQVWTGFIYEGPLIVKKLLPAFGA
jgi:dihydroorotate dehydrogenase